jgi:hypothetical protein
MWYNGILEGYWWEAKVFDRGSVYGINDGRVSKLSICKGDQWDHDQCVYNHDRGLDLDRLADRTILDKVLEYCASLPIST